MCLVRPCVIWLSLRLKLELGTPANSEDICGAVNRAAEKELGCDNPWLITGF
jgi:hypothetical protein